MKHLLLRVSGWPPGRHNEIGNFIVAMKYCKKTDRLVRWRSFLLFARCCSLNSSANIHASALIRINLGTNFVHEQCARTRVRVRAPFSTKELLACAPSIDDVYFIRNWTKFISRESSSMPIMRCSNNLLIKNESQSENQSITRVLPISPGPELNIKRDRKFR